MLGDLPWLGAQPDRGGVVRETVRSDSLLPGETLKQKNPGHAADGVRKGRLISKEKKQTKEKRRRGMSRTPK